MQWEDAWDGPLQGALGAGRKSRGLDVSRTLGEEDLQTGLGPKRPGHNSKHSHSSQCPAICFWLFHAPKPPSTLRRLPQGSTEFTSYYYLQIYLYGVQTLTVRPNHWCPIGEGILEPRRRMEQKGWSISRPGPRRYYPGSQNLQVNLQSGGQK